MDIGIAYLVEIIIRWLHVVSSIIWVGLLYFFNLVNGPFNRTLTPGNPPKGPAGTHAPGPLFFPLGGDGHFSSGVGASLLGLFKTRPYPGPQQPSGVLDLDRHVLWGTDVV